MGVSVSVSVGVSVLRPHPHIACECVAAGCTACRVGCDANAACPSGCADDSWPGGFCRHGCNITSGQLYARSSPRVCTTDVRDVLRDGKINNRCKAGWRRKSPSLFGCRPLRGTPLGNVDGADGGGGGGGGAGAPPPDGTQSATWCAVTVLEP